MDPRGRHRVDYSAKVVQGLSDSRKLKTRQSKDLPKLWFDPVLEGNDGWDDTSAERVTRFFV